ncbi:hypothetical protein K1719_043782 [Acacia pycnantha]|nr:hypothetical protein K1719_043782 [Acacia pycnantha]
MVAVSDCLNEFRLQRDEIVELLFSRKYGVWRNKNQVSNFSSGQVDEILRIKEILHNSKEEETEIGKSVNPLKKHGSKEIRQIARTLIHGWKAMVDEWIKSTELVCIDSSPGRQTNSSLPQKSKIGPMMQQKQETSAFRNRPLVSQQEC